MKRKVLSDGRWFDASKAEKFEEETRWDGSNHISLATGTQWSHEVLYCTAGKKWILHCWSQWQGSTETYSEISADDAARWLVKNEYDTPEPLSSSVALLEVG